jgi:hypothetical protein
LNDVLWRAITKAGVPASKEPVGLLRSDGKRPDGVTLIPWESGKCLTWDVTVTDTLAASNLSHSSLTAGSACEIAAEKKGAKYVELTAMYSFVPVAFETFGPVNTAGSAFIEDIGRRSKSISGDSRETSFLWQRLSTAMQRYNAVCLMGTFEALQDS